ncbi:hypothetical protein G6F65_013137 [Rhizopus arrhizus]|nr:hypothetical protein G6F65_013137 [Rhizopus arrhizus]
MQKGLAIARPFFIPSPEGLAGEDPGRHHRTEHDAVPGEHAVGVVGHEAQHGAHHHHRAQEGGNETHGDAGQVVLGQHAEVLVHVEDGRAQHRGHGQEERELGGRLTLNAGDHAADDGGARTRGARDHGKTLRHAHAQRLLPGDLFQRVGGGPFVGGRVIRRARLVARRVVRPALDVQHDQAAHHQSHHHHARMPAGRR